MALGPTPRTEPLMRYALWVDYLQEPTGALPQQSRSELRAALQQTLLAEGPWAALLEVSQATAARIEPKRSGPEKAAVA